MSPLDTAPVVDVERFVRFTDVSLDEAYALLANPRTRLTLHVLSTCEPPVSIDGLIRTVGQWDDADDHAVRVSLVHTVLPKLEAHDVLEYDRDAGRVHLERPVVAVDEPGPALEVAERAGANGSPT